MLCLGLMQQLQHSNNNLLINAVKRANKRSAPLPTLKYVKAAVCPPTIFTNNMAMDNHFNLSYYLAINYLSLHFYHMQGSSRSFELSPLGYFTAQSSILNLAIYLTNWSKTNMLIPNEILLQLIYLAKSTLSDAPYYFILPRTVKLFKHIFIQASFYLLCSKSNIVSFVPK